MTQTSWLESPLVVQEPERPRLAKGQSPATSRLTFPSVLYLEWIATSVSAACKLLFLSSISMFCLCVYVCVFFYCLCLCPVITYSHCVPVSVFLAGLWALLTTTISQLLPVTPVMDSLLINPVLAYVKAFRLRGDSDSLKHAALGKFAPAILAEAKRILWDKCSLSSLGLPLTSRRTTEKSLRQLLT